MEYLPPMTTTTIVIDDDFPGFVCVNCGHHHQYEDTIVRWDDGEVLCEDVEACERRGFLVVDEAIDPGYLIDPDPLMDEDCDPVEEASFPCDDGSSVGFYD
jgi:hypothetical protein